MLNVGGPGEGWVNVYTKQLVCYSNSFSSLQRDISKGKLALARRPSTIHFGSIYFHTIVSCPSKSAK